MFIKNISRRNLGLGAAAVALTACSKAGTEAHARVTVADNNLTDKVMSDTANTIDWANLSKADWKQRLTDMEFHVLRKEGTERPWTSPFNDNKAAGTYVCAGCALPLFKSEAKFDSGTGWPSFFDVIPGAVETKTDFKLIAPRTEYHCSRCGGHQGHVFKDGPAPTGLRYCNNGVALDFIEA